MSNIISITGPYLLFLGDVKDELGAKTSIGVKDWRPEQCLAQLRLPGCAADLGLPDMSPAEAYAKGARTMIVGVANSGGFFTAPWIAAIVEALNAGLDIASGLHTRLADVPEIQAASARTGRALYDVRHPQGDFKTGTGRRRSGKRLLAVGTDCSVGKMYTTLALEREMKKRGMNADFRATGQTGILICGSGVSVDAVVADFIAGATEDLAPDNAPDHWDVIEGQGSLFHPAFAGVSLGLLHGSQPDAIVLCHEPTRTHMRGLPDFPLPDLRDCLDGNLRAARLTNPEVRCIGLAINTAKLDAAAATAYLRKLEEAFTLPAVDPVRTGVGRLVDVL